MLTWQELSQQLQQIINTFIRFIKARRREEATIGIVAILFWIGSSLTKWLPESLQELIKSWHGDLIIPGVFYVVGLIFLGYGVYRIWKLVHVPDLPPPENRPSAIKGPFAFTPADGELFRKLGREDELRKLLGYIQDDQVRLVVLMGASGAGKTSLLRAGLTDILKDTDIKYHYWEAVPSESGKGLLRAIKQNWKSKPDDDSANLTMPELKSLNGLIQPAPEIGRHVIVLDQFEQLGAMTNSPVFRLLRDVIRKAEPPHYVTWVIAFRREYRSNWSDFIIPEQEHHHFFPPEISLRLFTPEKARDAISHLIQAADLSVEQKVINNLIKAATVEGEVSSVDIGIGLMVLAEMHERQGAKTLTQDIYHFAGGAEGLLTQYISRCLINYFPEQDHSVLLSAMLALQDAETNQRIAEGKTCNELAAEIKADNVSRLRTYLERLTQRDIRLLEHAAASKDNAIRYRLPHDRLIPALNRLAGKLISEIEEAKLKFVSAFSAWKSDGSSQYLLRGKALRLVDRYEAKIQWGSEKAEKLDFLKRSRRRRSTERLISGISITFFLLLIGTAIWLTISERSWHSTYPTELAYYQRNLKTLELKAYYFDLGNFDLLNSDTLEELSINVSSRTDSPVKGLAKNLSKCPKLRKLTLHIYGDAQIKDLTSLPSTITALSLDLSYTKTTELPPLPSNLTELTLDLNKSKLRVLPLLPNTLTKLTLNLKDSEIKELPPLPNTLTKLTLSFTNSEVKELPLLPSHLTDLTLDLRGSLIKKLPPLPDTLTDLTLDLIYNQVEELPLLPNSISKLTLALSGGTELTQLPNNLSELHLTAPYHQMEKLPPLPNTITKLDIFLHDGLELPRLPDATNTLTLNLISDSMEELPPLPQTITVLALNLNYQGNRMTKVPPLPNSLTALSLDLYGTQVKELPLLPNTITSLSVNLSYSKVKELPPLPSNLVELTLKLDNSQLKELPSLPNTLTKLMLDLNNSEIKELPPLPTSLTELTLNVGNSKVEDLPPLPTNITNLTLNLNYSNVRKIPQLPSNLTQLTLDLTNSKAAELPSLLLINCQKITLNLTDEQRMSLKAIPKSVTQLTF